MPTFGMALPDIGTRANVFMLARCLRVKTMNFVVSPRKISLSLFSALFAAIAFSASSLIPGAQAGATTARLSWHPCEKKFQCAVLQVPANYQNASEESLGISVIRLPASDGHPIGDIVLNPGGPGGSGISFLTGSWKSFPASLRKEFTLVSFDPRGVGASDPVNCTDTAGTRSIIALDPAPQTTTEVNQVVLGEKAFVAACKRNTPAPLLDNVSTLDTVKDLNQLRLALGDKELNYLGFSYGTYIGELFAKLYPNDVRTMVLDGVVNPAISTIASERQQAVGFEQDLNDFFNWCPSNKSCSSSLPNGAQTTLTSLLAQLKGGTTITAELAPQYGGTVKVDYAIALTAVVSSLYSSQTWPQLAQAIAQATRGNGELLAALAYSYGGLQQNGTFSNMIAANTAISCEDNPAPRTIAQYQTLASSLEKVAPIFGAGEAWGTLACAYWPVHPAQGPAPIVNTGRSPLLVIGSTGDPATPYEGAVAVAKQLHNAELLTRDGTGHTGYLFSSCIRSWTDRYFVSLKLPPVHTVCQTG